MLKFATQIKQDIEQKVRIWLMVGILYILNTTPKK